MSMPLNRSDLVLAAQTGNPLAIEQLLIGCQTDIRRYAYKHCFASDIDDAVQESLLLISRKVTQLKVVAAFSSWLFVIIKRECGRLARALLKHESLYELAEHTLASKTDYSLKSDLVNALESLPSHYMEVVLLRDFEELSISEIAERIGESAGSVKSRLHRARAMVREYMIGAGRKTDKQRQEEAAR